MTPAELESFIREVAPEYDLDAELSLRQAGELERLSCARIAELWRVHFIHFVCDPDSSKQNVRCGMTLMQSLLERYKGDRRKAYAAWHWGAADIDGAIHVYGEQHWEEHVPTETLNYVHKIVGRPDNIVSVPHRPGTIARHGTEVIPDKKAA